ncbi:putative DNA binding domain-containing protein [Hymenobacter sp. 5516J-16]|uniref:ATP-binding protein n=1 Tax=Hymenobacter sp. 5516J-16 TaxID=2932253 RepID=UPI001FD0746A|nr:ATP-binding protein [Hymenobacter sp. 5516J-16]UOQ78060.1 putative DNA binding domain-containing protein [Hymenobacter sp. 5516J-16]
MRDGSDQLDQLLQLHSENEVVEFKEAKNTFDFDKLGQYFSALSNEASLQGTEAAWLVFGVDDQKQVVGTSFRQDSGKLQSLYREIADQTGNRLTFRAIHEIFCEEKRVLLFEIPPAALGSPTSWKGHYYGRDGESLGPLNPDERRRLEWQGQTITPFERRFAFLNASVSHILSLLDWEGYYKLFNYPKPTNAQDVVARFVMDKIVIRENQVLHITNLGAVLFARDLRQFDQLEYKRLRIIFYDGTGRTGGKQEHTGHRGYALGFENALNWLNEKLPNREEIGSARRVHIATYPPKAIRELLANALIHQNFDTSGSAPMVEVFTNRIEVSNPGVPLINVLQFLNHLPVSRNEAIAATMHALDFCERRGSGIDRIVEECEKHLLPAPDFIRGTILPKLFYTRLGCYVK